jgi:hypothetical protein
VQAALAALPWVESDTIKPNRDKRQVKFTVKDPKRFDLDAVKKALTEKGYDEANVLTGPTEK